MLESPQTRPEPDPTNLFQNVTPNIDFGVYGSTLYEARAWHKHVSRVLLSNAASPHFMEPPSQSDAAQPKRRRPPQSCIQCRQRKVRCDRTFPCGPCTRARSSLGCSYNSSTRPNESASTRATPSSQQHNRPLPGRHAPHTPISLSNYDGRNELAAGGDLGTGVSQKQTSIEELQDRIHQLEEIVAKNTGTHYVRQIGTDHLRTSSQSSGSRAAEEHLIKAPLPRLRNFVEKTKIFGANNWLHTVAEFQVLGDFLSEDVPFSERFKDRTELVNLLRECINFRVVSKARHRNEDTLPLLDISSIFPPKTVCDELVQCYMRTFEPIYRILYAPSFWEEYDLFWERPQTVPKHFVVKLALILAIGSAFHPIQNDPIHYEDLVQEWIYAAQWWLAGPSDRASFTLDGLQVGCLLILSRSTGPSSTPLWISTGSLLQMAMMMGLHRDTTLFPSLAPWEMEMRNRLWAAIVELNVQALLDSGVPFPLSLDEFDSKSPNNINDEDIRSEAKEHPEPEDDHVFTDSSIQRLLWKSINARLEIARLLNDPLRQNLTFEKSIKLGHELRAACRETSVFFQMNTSNSRGQDAHRFDFQRKFLDMYLHRYMHLLHRPFMIEARRDPRYYLSRKTCVESAMVIASHCEKMDSLMENRDDLSRLTYVGSGSFKGVFSMDVITVLGLELVMQVEEEDSTRTSSMPRTTAADPLGELARANRAPLIRCLERIKEQLEYVIMAGRPSLKRYVFVVGILALARAIDCGLPIHQTIVEDLTASLKKCRTYLYEYQSNNNNNNNNTNNGHPEQIVVDLPDVPGDLPDISTLFPMSDIDPNTSFGFSDLLMLPNLLEPSSMRW